MLRLLLLSAFALSVFAQAIPAPCRIEGRVLSAATSSPLKRATLHAAFRGHLPPGYSVNDPTDFEAASDAEGRFVFDAIPPSRFYFLTAERPGYLSYEPDRNLDCTVATSGHEDLVIKLVPHGMISGRVLDDDGEPVAGADVEVLRRIFVNGTRHLNQIDTESTHADGSFAIGGLKPGRYYVRASHRKERDRPSAPGRKEAQTEAFLPAFFPAAFDIGGATPIDVAAGAQISAVDFRLKRSRVYRVSGKVATPASRNPLGQIELTLRQQDGPPAAPSSEVQGWQFEFRDILPGSYVLRPDNGGSGENRSALVGSAPVTVRDSDVHDVVLTLGPPIELKVTSKTDPDDGELPGSKDQRIFLFLPDGGRNPERSWKTDKEGKFIAALSPGRYRLEMLSLAYPKSIRLNGQEVAADAIDLSATSTLDVVVSMNGAELSVIARDADGQAAANSIMQACDSRGVCYTGIRPSYPPGEYRVCAWAGDGDGIISVPQFRSAFDAQCNKIKLAEKAHESIELKLITKEAMDAEAAKMP